MEAARRLRLRSFATAAHQIDLEDAALDRLERYVALLAVWNKTTRLTGSADEGTLVELHVADSLAVVPLVPAGGTYVDIGSGAGFPGLVIAAVRADVSGRLIEPRRRRASFLAEAVRTMPLDNAVVDCARAEEISAGLADEGRVDVAVSRAIRLDQFLPLASAFLRPGGIAIAMQSIARAATAEHQGTGLEPTRSIEYPLPDGSRRRLLLYQRVC